MLRDAKADRGKNTDKYRSSFVLATSAVFVLRSNFVVGGRRLAGVKLRCCPTSSIRSVTVFCQPYDKSTGVVGGGSLVLTNGTVAFRLCRHQRLHRLCTNLPFCAKRLREVESLARDFRLARVTNKRAACSCCTRRASSVGVSRWRAKPGNMQKDVRFCLSLLEYVCKCIILLHFMCSPLCFAWQLPDEDLWMCPACTAEVTSRQVRAVRCARFVLVLTLFAACCVCCISESVLFQGECRARLASTPYHCVGIGGEILADEG